MTLFSIMCRGRGLRAAFFNVRLGEHGADGLEGRVIGHEDGKVGDVDGGGAGVDTRRKTAELGGLDGAVHGEEALAPAMKAGRGRRS